MNIISSFDYCAVAGSTVDGGCEGSFVRSFLESKAIVVVLSRSTSLASLRR